ncbi:MAG: acetyl-CoA carboxylase biotin carboxylase subunit [Ignavibacteriales bacterium]|nr:acetyl-CoA carboxylase biotin carboxylase subunit [Ignavibacteriales bacterium]
MIKRSIKKILISNRGEIAVRIIKSCSEMGIKTVSIYSDVDVYAIHARLADESYCVGPAPARDSYLNQDKIIEIAKLSGCDAIHPGYGFLSENSSFAHKVTENNLKFIGPSAAAMKLMGDKTSARSFAIKIGVQIVPGTTDPIDDISRAIRVADEIGYPILIKAAGGGGGKGMRIIKNANELEAGLKASKSEALSAFSDGRVFIEKYIENPRHIEVQVLADAYGNVVHFGERECSIQRRHQKIIEESPSTYINETIRTELTQAAVSLVKEAGYTNAGTVEFIFDQNKKFYFLEMNTRLQVEHPITEMRIGYDLVKEQIKISEGNRLDFSQKDVKFDGHSMECRIYAEDPYNNFFPSTGKIIHLQVPSGLGIRDDRGVEERSEISPYYDPLISKLITFGKTREETRSRMSAALKQYHLIGLRNNINFCSWITSHPKFISGEYDTGFIEKYFSVEELDKPSEELVNVAIIAAIGRIQNPSQNEIEKGAVNSFSNWKNKKIDGFN